MISKNYEFEYRDNITQKFVIRIINVLDKIFVNQIVFFEFNSILDIDLLSFNIIRKIIDEPVSYNYIFMFSYNCVFEKVKNSSEIYIIYAQKIRLILEIVIIQNEWTKAQYLINKLLNIKRKIKNKRLLGQIYFRAGMVSHRKGLLFQSKKYYLLSKKNFEEIEDEDNLIKALNNLGNIYILQEEYAIARDILKKSLALSEYKQEDYSLAVTYGMMGKALMKLGNFTEAVDYLKKSRLYTARSGFFYNVHVIYGLLGDAYYYLKNFTLAMEFFETALYFSRLENIKIDEGENLMRIGKTFSAIGNNPVSANEYFALAEKIFNHIDYKYGFIFLYEAWGNHSTRLKNYSDAQNFYYKSCEIARNLRNKKMLIKLQQKIKNLKKLK